jgi:hypothetical protein
MRFEAGVAAYVMKSGKQIHSRRRVSSCPDRISMQRPYPTERCNRIDTEKLSAGCALTETSKVSPASIADSANRSVLPQIRLAL